ncbi:MAG: phosphatidate cytidylyltransferase [bacterium]|nr:phosphatidate cytidylyltransferase [bacterium]
MSPNQNHPIHRIISTILFTPILLFCLFSRQPWWFAILVTGVAVWGIIEFYNLAGIKGFEPFRRFGYLLVLLFCLNALIKLRFATTTQLLVFLILGSFLLGIYRFNPQNNHSILRISTTVLGVLYIGFPLSLLLYIWQLPRGKFYLLWLIAVTWFCDIGTYTVGSLIGKHKLCRAISPKKTVEGCIGGILFSLGFAVIIRWIFDRYFFTPLFPPFLNLIFAFGIAIIAQLGDLAESILKREVNVKDSGETFTGHGGILDIIDSLLFTSPVLYLILIALY